MSNKDVYAMILVDTGNTTQNNIISEEFFLLTGLPLVQQGGLTLGTADSQGGGLKVIGRVAELKLHLEGMKAPVHATMGSEGTESSHQSRDEVYARKWSQFTNQQVQQPF